MIKQRRQWKLSYLERKFTPVKLTEWTKAKRQELEDATGVPWSNMDSAGQSSVPALARYREDRYV